MTDEELAEKKLRMIEELARAGRYEAVMQMAKELIARHPESDASNAAQTLLAQVNAVNGKEL